MKDTIKYYEENAKEFYDSTINITFNITQDIFLSYLAKNSYILDFGCGSGRDTAYFLSKGYSVDAVDGSLKLCELASAYTKIPVKQMLFQDLNEINKYDGIWACSSILHLDKITLNDVLSKMTRALKEGGIIYTSFKYSNFEGMRNGRYFTDFTEDSFQKFIMKNSDLHIEKLWITNDARKERSEEKWLNVILKKK